MRYFVRFVPLLAALSAAPAFAQSTAPLAVAGSIGVLQTLDKVTGRVRVLEAPVGEPVQFGPLTIIVRACRKRAPEEPPETAAFLEIVERKTGEMAVDLFKGWMFASSPAVSALEHPVYDVWVNDCKAARTAGSGVR
ncbi:MAG: DUF2155 domain-containing protein [Telmatospirillum sp.]|nr:DUF2155 domain-containing protein [Telmatospirillum sp.]